MIIKKNIYSFFCIVLLALSVSTAEAVDSREDRPISNYNKAIHFLLNYKTAIAVPIIALVAYSVILGDIPFVDIPQELLEYFDLTSWGNYFTTSSEILLDSESGVEESITLIDDKPAQIKSLLQTLSGAEIKAIIEAIPASILKCLPQKEVDIIFEKMAQGINFVSESEISGLVKSIKACIALLKESGEKLSSRESVRLFGIYFKHYDLVDQLEAIIKS
ncbi:hypothetical protein JST56_00655 [Candidatus Dependentiae bacterium]|nr:hypothetical protein [Candidatus Dependentiae bacterium]